MVLSETEAFLLHDRLCISEKKRIFENWFEGERNCELEFLSIEDCTKERLVSFVYNNLTVDNERMLGISKLSRY